MSTPSPTPPPAAATAPPKSAAPQATAPPADPNVVNIEVNGVPLKARKGQMLIEVTDQADVYVPRFCYHRKLSIAANCRMCLVEVEKVPKPLKMTPASPLELTASAVGRLAASRWAASTSSEDVRTWRTTQSLPGALS